MALYGIYGSHTTESCPLNNAESRRQLLATARDLEEYAKKYKIGKILGQYHSSLEHTFLWAIDAEDPHLIEKFCIEIGLAKFNTIKIIPLITFDELIKRTKEL